ncbi:PREDICTED: protein CASC5, partial [Leptosomus discolor]|uniref:protein CASC5 n=1 Tax=Leptosomus discolor TaxID=188344 RepID=UPI000522A644
VKNLKLFRVRSLWHDADNATQRTNRHDTTLIFSDENEMDVTASHTAVITRDLESNEADKTEKIDITWFLAQLNSNNGKAQTSKEFQFFSDPTDHSCLSFEQKEDATAVKKINFSEFLMSLKSNEKACDPIEGPEKENVLFVPSPVSEDVAQSLVEFVYSHEPPDTCNATQVFRGQDGGMEMTKCQASEVRAVFSGTCEAPPEQLVCADVTEAFVDDGMDMTTSHTAKVSFPFSSVGNQNLNFQKDFPSTEGEIDSSRMKDLDGEYCAKSKGSNKGSRQNFSPSQFIAEEFLPVCLEEMDSNESVSSELMESACNERRKKQTSHHEKNQSEETKTCNTKRALEQEEEDLQSPKKVKRDENLEGEASQDLQVTFGTVSQSQAEVHEGEDPPNLSAKSPDCAPASTSGSLDSVKADTELTSKTGRSSQMESRLLTDSICEDNLWEKFQNGVITVGEFFTLLQVHVPIQKPRHSHIPASCAVSTPPTPEDLLYSQYVYRPKVHVYEEDCQALAQKIEELKPYVNVLDQLLVNVNKTLWEVMRTCSDDELKSFGAELNKMKSCFTKESKILAHNEKVTLYSKLLQSAQEQHGKLQSRIEKVDEALKEAESCLLALGVDADWEEREGDGSDEVAGGKHLKEELESIKAQEEELQRELSDLETQNEQMLAEINQLEEETKCWQELVEKYDFTEWEITEWSQEQAVFTFLHDSIELTVVFGPPIDGDEFGEDPSRKIVSLNFESLLDDEEAPPSSCLVLRLIFQFIESQGCWQEKCPTLHYLPQVLHDVSLVVSHCKILGEEIEFLERWGGKFNLLKTNISDTRVKLLFSSSVAFAKFELTLSLSADYPSASLPSTVQKYIGNIGEEEISAVLSNVPTGHHYLRRIVSLIHQNLLQDPR